MTEKEVCLMCENYSEDTKCDQHDSCKLMAVLKENRALKKKVSQLKRQLDESELKRSYMVNPNAANSRQCVEYSVCCQERNEPGRGTRNDGA